MINYPRGSGRNVQRARQSVAGISQAAKREPAGGAIPLETVEAQHFIKLCSGAALIFPELAHVVHIANEGKRTKAAGGKLLAEGLRSGYPDYQLDISRGGYYGWRGELKRIKYHYPEPEQYDWLTQLRTEGYWANWHRGVEAIFSDLIAYLSLETTYTPPRGWKQPAIENKPEKRKGKHNGKSKANDNQDG